MKSKNNNNNKNQPNKKKAFTQPFGNKQKTQKKLLNVIKQTEHKRELVSPCSYILLSNKKENRTPNTAAAMKRCFKSEMEKMKVFWAQTIHKEQ